MRQMRSLTKAVLVQIYIVFKHVGNTIGSSSVYF